MAELATIARPYAEALFQATGSSQPNATSAVATEMNALSAVTADHQVRRFAASPKVSNDQVFELLMSVVDAPKPLSAGVQNLVRMVIENGRLDALPEIATQFHALVNERSGTSDAVIHSAYPMDAAAIDGAKRALEKRFGRTLAVSVVVEPELIGGVRVVVGDEVLDLSIKARLEQMKAALTA